MSYIECWLKSGDIYEDVWICVILYKVVLCVIQYIWGMGSDVSDIMGG
jgi:hypothetical protein